MKKLLLTYCFFLFFTPVLLFSQKVVSIKIDGSINPVSADFIHYSIENAAKEKAECIIIELNTPGGLLSSTRNIVADIMQAPLPVIVYVSPSGAHAGSAGIFITLAAHVAVMAEGTNIGAAHPVVLQGQMDSTMNEKATNDAAAFIRSIAEKRNRNADLAEMAVRRSLSYTATEALKDSAIDFMANNMQELLVKLEGRTVELASGRKTLHTATATVTESRMNRWENFLNVLSNPNIAYVLMLLGIFGVLFELFNPGAILPGVVGGISLILAFYAMHTLPVNYAGLGLIIFAIILFILEIKIISHGLLAIGGTIALFLGSMMLIKSGTPMGVSRISTGLIVASTVVSAAFFLFILGFGIKAQNKRVVTGVEGMKGETGEAMDALSPLGRVAVLGEIWNARAISGEINAGEKVRIVSMKDLVLYVEPIS